MEEDSPLELSGDVFDMWIVDFIKGEIAILMRDGTRHSEPLAESEIPEDSQIAASIFHWDKWWISIVTNRLDPVFLMGFNPESDDQAPSFPTVYLDQNMWSRVAAARIDPERVQDEKEREAALEIARLASDAGIVLPLSSGHLVETSGLHTERRYEVGLAIADLSNGWQMRHPINVWQHEAAAALSAHCEKPLDGDYSARSVITTEPFAWQKGDDFGFGAGLPSTYGTMQKMLTAPAVLVSTLIDPEKLPRVQSTKWVDHHQGITRQIATLEKGRRSRTARRRYWNENIGFYRSALGAIPGLDELPMFSDQDLGRFLKQTRMISLLSELFVQRFIDGRAVWKSNDLVDMLYLSCAAGYCDYVVAEARTGTQLRQIQRTRGESETVFTKLSDLVEALHATGVNTETDRLAKSAEN